MIRGLEFVVSDVPTRGCPNGAVANMSLRSSVSAALNAAAAALPSNDIFLAVSAGNSNIDSSNQSPAAEPTVCTIGATDSADAKSSFSNYGPGVDVFAPGTSVLSLAPGNLTVSLS
jgi:subtilisin family serine protease